MCRSKQMLGDYEAASWPLGVLRTLCAAPALRGRRRSRGHGRLESSRPAGRRHHVVPWAGYQPGSGCSLVETGHCDLLEKADFVLNDLGTANARDAAVARAVDDAVHGDKHVAVVAGWQQAESLRGDLPGSTVVEGPLTTKMVEDAARVR